MSGGRSVSAARSAMALLLALGLAACTPLEAPSGPPVGAPPQVHADSLLAADGVRLPLRAWMPAGDTPRALVLALHGFNDYSAFFDNAARALATHGVASFAYDQRGFGAAPNRGVWPGEATLVGDVHAAVAALRTAHPGVPLFLFGESMGGAVAMVTMADPVPPAVDGVILSAPAVWGRRSMPWYQTTALWIAVRTWPWGKLTGEGVEVHPSDNIEMLRSLSRDPLVLKGARIDALWGLVNLMDAAMAAAPSLDGRMLLLYGARDDLIPPGVIEEMLQRLPEGGAPLRQVVRYANGYHMLTRDLQAETVVLPDLAAWIADPGGPLPSQARVPAAPATIDAGRPAVPSAAPTGGACPDRAACAIVPAPVSTADRHS